MCHFYLCALSDGLYTIVKVTVDPYYKCLGIPPLMKKCHMAVCIVSREGEIMLRSEFWLYKFLCTNVLIPSLPVIKVWINTGLFIRKLFLKFSFHFHSLPPVGIQTLISFAFNCWVECYQIFPISITCSPRLIVSMKKATINNMNTSRVCMKIKNFLC